MAGRPIVILGLCKRTGTNFLAQLLRRHPDVGQAPPVWEHFLLNEADALVRYAKKTRKHWSAQWGDLDALEADLLAHVGGGAMQFLIDRTPAERLVAKTPSVQNLALAPSLFGGADVIVLVRDGRATAASLTKGFDWTFERSIRTWSRGAAEARKFLDGLGVDPSNSDNGVVSADGPNDLRVALVRYEDFAEPTTASIDALLEFCRLDTDRFDRQAAADMPVYGTSFGSDEAEVTWKAAAKTDDFDPTKRFAGWSAAEHSRFDHVGGELNEWFGYDRSGSGGSVSHRVADTVWPARKQVMRVAAKLQSLRGG